MKKLVSFLVIAALILSLLPFSVFAADISKIEYTPADENAYVFCEGENAEIRHDDELDVDYFSYIINFNVGDTLSVYYGDTTRKDYVAEFIGGELYFVNGDERLRQWVDVNRYEDQYENHWQPGNEYTFYIQYAGFNAPVTAKIIENPVDSITYTPSKGVVTRYFETGGQMDTDANENEYYRYNVIERGTGDVLTVSYNDGRGDIDYVLTFEPEPRFVSETNPEDFIPENKVEMYDEQWQTHFALGDDNYFYVRYMGKTAPVTVEIVNNPIKSLVYTPVSDIVLYENANGEWRVNGEGEDYFDYNFWYRPGDKIEVTYSDTGNTVIYTYLDGEYNDEYYNGFYDEEYAQMPDSTGENSKLFVSRIGEWQLGNDNFVFAKYLDNESNYVPVSIIENPVKGIRYERDFNVEIIEGAEMYYDSFDDMYYYSIPYYRYGDKLIVIDKDNNETVYEFDGGRDAFIAEGKDDIPSNEVRFESNQREHPWVIGENTYTVDYLGYRYDLKATVIENPIESIEYIPFDPVTYWENTNVHYDEWDHMYYYDYRQYCTGDQLIVNYKDPTRGKVTYTATYVDEIDQTVFLSEQDSISTDYDTLRFYDEQREHPWTIGVNYYYVTYFGKSAAIPVTITENNLAGISYTPHSTPTVWEDDYDIRLDDLGHEYKYYAIPDFKEGDILTVSYTNAPSKDFVFSFNEADGEFYFINGDDKISKFALMCSEKQSEKEWAVGTENSYTVDLYGFTADVPVQVIVNDEIESISYTPVAEIVLKENEGGMYRFNDHGEQFFEYDHQNLATPGDKLTLVYKNNTQKVYTLDIDPGTGAYHLRADDNSELDINELDIVDNQWSDPWMPGINYFTVKYHGVRDNVPVTIKPEYIPGDINGDEVVNNKDLTALLKYLSGCEVEVIDKALDVNADGYVNNKDLIRLLKYLSGWDVMIF